MTSEPDVTDQEDVRDGDVTRNHDMPVGSAKGRQDQDEGSVGLMATRHANLKHK